MLPIQKIRATSKIGKLHRIRATSEKKWPKWKNKNKMKKMNKLRNRPKRATMTKPIMKVSTWKTKADRTEISILLGWSRESSTAIMNSTTHFFHAWPLNLDSRSSFTTKSTRKQRLSTPSWIAWPRTNWASKSLTLSSIKKFTRPSVFIPWTWILPVAS